MSAIVTAVATTLGTSVVTSAASSLVSYMFPQVGATIQSYRMATTAYNVGRSVIGFFSGNPMSIGSIFSLAQTVTQEVVERDSCEKIRDDCIKCTMTINSGVGAGCGIVGCHLAYMVCTWMR